MALLEDVGKISFGKWELVFWEIPNFYELPQDVDTVIRSPRFRHEEREWYIEVYPNGCSSYCSSGWFGISAFLVNSDSTHRSVTLGIDLEENDIRHEADFCEHKLYNCIKFLPASLLHSARDILLSGGNLRVSFETDEEADGDDAFLKNFHSRLLSKDKDVFFNAYMQLSGQTEQQVVKEERKQKHDDTYKELRQTGKESEIPSEIIDVGDIVETVDGMEWIIPNFYELSQEYNTILRSPRFRFKDRGWYAEAYPNGCSSYDCSSGWFGITIFNLNSDVRSRIFMKIFISGHENGVFINTKLYGETFYNYMKFLPNLFLKSAKNSLLQGENLHILLEPEIDEDEDEQDLFGINLKREDAEKCFEICVPGVRQTEEDTGSKGIKHNHGDACTEECKQTQN